MALKTKWATKLRPVFQKILYRNNCYPYRSTCPVDPDSYTVVVRGVAVLYPVDPDSYTVVVRGVADLYPL